MEVRKICKKSFSSGKGLGGHIRSHLAKHPLPPKSAPTRRRSSRRSRRTALSEEEAALFLIQLSRDTWHKTRAKQVVEEEEEEEGGMVVLVPASNNNKMFRCEDCDREFGSYQALGGHKANHKKVLSKNNNNKNLLQITENEDEDEEFEEDDEEERGNNNNNNNNNKKSISSSSSSSSDDVMKKKRGFFECEFCYKVFGSGQALGGHKKAHFSAPLMPPNKISAVSSAGTLVIDLNFPPLSEDDDYAYARQSHLVD